MGSTSEENLKAFLPEPYLSALARVEELARLWAGYGYIYRLHFHPSANLPSCIVKYVSPPAHHGNSDDEGAVRKLASYRVESNFYQHLSSHFNDRFGPRFETALFLSRPIDSGLVLSDLKRTHPIFPGSRSPLQLGQALASLDWFAAFHSYFWGYRYSSGKDCEAPRELMKHNDGLDSWKGAGVWRIGTYNHLATRLDELLLIPTDSDFSILRGPLAFAVESSLQDPLQPGATLVHGDAKSANLALGPASNYSHEQASSTETTEGPVLYPADWNAEAQKWNVAMFDFQYVGPGVPTQDLIKFLTTAIPASHLRSQSDELKFLRFYHDRLCYHLSSSPGYMEDTATFQSKSAASDAYPFELFERQWRLSLLSWIRFTEGWGSWGNTDWLEDRGREILSDTAFVESVITEWTAKGREGQETLIDLGLAPAN